ncbi:MAG: alpha/beta fold hydrolase [Thermoleophilaceae bacterium]|nr:alpha/beta fold hydrolase [Thermoleophilaceae bacterium]
MNPTPGCPELSDEAPLVPVVLVHGAWHSPAIWDPVTELLEDRGHRVSVPNLPIASTTAGSADFADVIAAACDGDDPPVIVCHTTGSLTALLVPERQPVRQFIHVNGLLPKIGMSFSEQTSSDDFEFGEDSGRRYDREARSFWDDRSKFDELLAHDCDEPTRVRLWNQLRHQSRKTIREVSPLTSWPDTPTAAILYSNDVDLPIEWLRRTTLERLKVEPVELPGSQLGFNARPRLFVKTLLKLIAAAPVSPSADRAAAAMKLPQRPAQ